MGIIICYCYHRTCRLWLDERWFWSIWGFVYFMSNQFRMLPSWPIYFLQPFLWFGIVIMNGYANQSWVVCKELMPCQYKTLYCIITLHYSFQVACRRDAIYYLIWITHLQFIEAKWRIFASVQHANMASDNGLSCVRRQAIIGTSETLWNIFGSNFAENWNVFIEEKASEVFGWGPIDNNRALV